MREPGATLDEGERFRAPRQTSDALRFLKSILGCSLGGGGFGLVYAQFGDSGFFARGFDAMIYGALGVLAGGVLGILVDIVLVVRARSASKRRR